MIKGNAWNDAVNFEQTLRTTSADFRFSAPGVSGGVPKVRRVGNVCEVNTKIIMQNYVSQGARVMQVPEGYKPVISGSGNVAFRQAPDGSFESVNLRYTDGYMITDRVIQGSVNSFFFHWTYICIQAIPQVP